MPQKFPPQTALLPCVPVQIQKSQRGYSMYLRTVHFRVAYHVQIHTLRSKRKTQPKRVVFINSACQQGDIWLGCWIADFLLLHSCSGSRVRNWKFAWNWTKVWTKNQDGTVTFAAWNATDAGSPRQSKRKLFSTCSHAGALFVGDFYAAGCRRG